MLTIHWQNCCCALSTISQHHAPTIPRSTTLTVVCFHYYITPYSTTLTGFNEMSMTRSYKFLKLPTEKPVMHHQPTSNWTSATFTEHNSMRQLINNITTKKVRLWDSSLIMSVIQKLAQSENRTRIICWANKTDINLLFIRLKTDFCPDLTSLSFRGLMAWLTAKIYKMGQKNQTCLSVDNSAMVSGRKMCDTSKISECCKE